SATGAGPGPSGGRLGSAVAVPVRSAVAVPVPPSPAAGGAGGAAWPARPVPRRGRRKNRPPPTMASTTTMAMTMIRISITAPVSQMCARLRPSLPRRYPGSRGRSGALGLPQALAHDRGDAVTLHADPVQRVRGLHRPLLVGDDDQLRGVPQLLEDLQEALEVGVVE